MDFLERIQSKSSSVKTRYAFLGAGFVTVAIALVWMSTIPARFAQVSLNTEVKDEKAPSLGELVNNTKNQLGNVIDSVDGIDETNTEPTNMDSLNMQKSFTPSETSGEAGNVQTVQIASTGTTTSETPIPVLTNEQETHQVLETPKSEGRVILIGTTTSNQ